MLDTCPPARSLGVFSGLGVSFLALVGLVSGCGGYYVDRDSYSQGEPAPVVEHQRPPPGVPTSSAPPGGSTSSEPPPPGVPSRGGFVVVTGDDADDMWHCEESRCGGLYPSLFRAALSRSRSGGKGILAIGVNGGQALATFNSWNSPTHGGPNARVTHVLSAGDISRVDFNRFAFVYLPSAERHTQGGLSDAQIAALNARQPDLARFVNERGGSLIALTQAEVPGGWGFLPMPLQTHDIPFDVAEPTPALLEFSPALSAFELSHKSFHNVFTGPSGFSGLRVLAYNNEAFNPYSGAPVMLGGSAVILTAEDCADGRDNDGDGAVDGQDTDCHVCGNGTVDPGEACDDGNQAGGDGCGATCQKENRAPEATCHDVSVCTDAGVCAANVPASVATATDLDGDAISWDLHPLGPYAPGTRSVRVTASDGQAQAACWSRVTVRDCEAPALACPADFTVECSGQGRAAISPPPATATDNCGTASVTQPEARTLPLGSHTLAYSAVDASGNTATCAPKVTVVDTLPPYVVCPERIVAECTGRNSAYVVPGMATAIDSCTAAQVSGPMADWYPLGSNVVRYSAKDTSGNESSCTSAIEVVDQTPPTVTLSPPAPLWPVDQQYRTVRLEDCIVVHDQCSGGLTQTGASASISCVSSDEARSGSEPDVVFVDATTVKVRVDRAATGNGRVYSLHFEVRDTAGNLTRGICPVGVPLERGGAPVIDSGESWRSCRPSGEGLAWKPIPVAG
ncbi:HYR domain-containing protein [Archangium gephyra]|uniref:HYR domain-containing protein n=1 Tax=Archangium gephyra TaxID=48 RepID=UPI003B77553F